MNARPFDEEAKGAGNPQGAVFRQGAPPFGKKNEPYRVLLLDASRLFPARIQSVVVVNEAIVVCWYRVLPGLPCQPKVLRAAQAWTYSIRGAVQQLPSMGSDNPLLRQGSLNPEQAPLP